MLFSMVCIFAFSLYIQRQIDQIHRLSIHIASDENQDKLPFVHVGMHSVASICLHCFFMLIFKLHDAVDFFSSHCSQTKGYIRVFFVGSRVILINSWGLFFSFERICDLVGLSKGYSFFFFYSIQQIFFSKALWNSNIFLSQTFELIVSVKHIRLRLKKKKMNKSQSFELILQYNCGKETPFIIQVPFIEFSLECECSSVLVSLNVYERNCLQLYTLSIHTREKFVSSFFELALEMQSSSMQKLTPENLKAFVESVTAEDIGDTLSYHRFVNVFFFFFF